MNIKILLKTVCIAFAMINTVYAAAPTVTSETGCISKVELISVSGAGTITKLKIKNNGSEPIVVDLGSQTLYEVATTASGLFAKSNLTLSGSNIDVYFRANPVFENQGTSGAYSFTFYNISSQGDQSNFIFYTDVNDNLGIPNPQITVSVAGMATNPELRLQQIDLGTTTGVVSVTSPNVGGSISVNVIGTTNDLQYLNPTNPNAFKAFQYIKISTAVGIDFVNTPSNFTLPANFSGQLRFQTHVPASETVKPYILLVTLSGDNLESKTFNVSSNFVTTAELNRVLPGSISGLNSTISPSGTISDFTIKTITINGTGSGNPYRIETASWMGLSLTNSSNINDYITRPFGSKLEVPNTGGVIYCANISTILSSFNNSIEIRQFNNSGPDYVKLIPFIGETFQPIKPIFILNSISETYRDGFLTSGQTINKNPDGVSNVVAVSIVGNGLSDLITVSGTSPQRFGFGIDDFGYRVSATQNGIFSESITLPASGGIAYVHYNNTITVNNLFEFLDRNNAIFIKYNLNRVKNVSVHFPSTVTNMPKINIAGVGNATLQDDGYFNEGFNFSNSHFYPTDRIPVQAFRFLAENFTGPITVTSGLNNIANAANGSFVGSLVINSGDVVYTKVIPGDNNGVPTFDPYLISAFGARNAKSTLEIRSRTLQATITTGLVLFTSTINFDGIQPGRNTDLIGATYISNYASISIAGFNLPDPITLTGSFYAKVSTTTPTIWSNIATLPSTGGVVYVALDKQVVGGYCATIEVKSGSITKFISVQGFANAVNALSGVVNTPIIGTATGFNPFPTTFAGFDNNTSNNLLAYQSTNFSVSPSPTTGFVKVSEAVDAVNVYSTVGNLVVSATSNEFYIPAKGLFIVEIIAKNIKYYSKVVVE